MRAYQRLLRLPDHSPTPLEIPGRKGERGIPQKRGVSRGVSANKAFKNKIILDLCGGTGSWSKPYRDAGYDVRVVTLPDFDITKTAFTGKHFIFSKDGTKMDMFVNLKDIHGILAAPPCTMFSFARTNAKKPRDIKEGMVLVRQCFEIIWACMEVRQNTNKKTIPLAWWALENPYHGFLKKIIGKPAFTFDPYEFGDGYKKRTAIWGNFNEPRKSKNPGHARPNWSSKKFFSLQKAKNIISSNNSSPQCLTDARTRNIKVGERI